MAAAAFKIIGADDRVYGPTGLEELREWVGEGRVDAQSWVYEVAHDRWSRAGMIAALADLFAPAGGGTKEKTAVRKTGLQPMHLRCLKVFTDMSEDQLTVFCKWVEQVQFSAMRYVVRANEPGDSMYLILSGEVRVTQTAGGRETTLATMGQSEFFGEMCLFEPGPRSADVQVVRDCTLLKISQAAFQEVMQKHPDVALRFLFAVLRAVESRMRAVNKKYVDSMAFAKGWQEVLKPTAVSAPPRRK